MMMGLGEGTEDADAAVADEEEKDILKHHHYFVDKHLTLKILLSIIVKNFKATTQIIFHILKKRFSLCQEE